jgi:hypothetical protein
MQTDETSNQNSDRTKLAMETMKRYCDAHPQSPSALRRPHLLLRGAVWIAVLGPSVSEGIAGFGYTVEAALRAFDAQYLRGSDKPVAGQTPTLPDAPRASELGQTREKIAQRVKEQTSEERTKR